MADEIQNLILQVQGTQKAEALRDALKAEEATLRELNDVIRQNGSLTATQEAQQQRTAASMVAHRKELDKLEKSHRGFGGAALQASYAVQDLTAQNGDLLRGFMAIQNNIPGLVMSFGGSMGLAGAIGAVSLAAALATPWITKMIKELDPHQANNFRTALELLNEEIKRIEERKIKISTDATDLQHAKKEIQDIQEGMKGFEEWKRQHTDWEKKSGAEVGSQLANAPDAEKVRKGIYEAEEKHQLETFTPLKDAQVRYKNITDEMDKLEKFIAGLDPLADMQQGTQARARRDQLRKQRDTTASEITNQRENAKKEAETNTGLLYSRATEGNQTAQRELVKRLRESGQGELAANIEFNSAANLKKESDEKAQQEREMENEQTVYAVQQARRTYHSAVPEWEAMSPERRGTYYHPGDTEAQALTRFGEERGERVMNEALHPEPPKTEAEETSRIAQAREDEERRRTPLERARHEQQMNDIDSAARARQSIRPLSPQAQANDQIMREEYRAREGVQQSAGQLTNTASQVTIGYLQQIQAENAQYRAWFQEYGAMMRQAQQNLRGMQRPMSGMGYGGPFGGDFSY